MRDLYPHQTRAIELLKESFLAGNTAPLLSAPTGSGKTLIASTITKKAFDKGRRVCFVVPALSLIDQTVESFYSEGITDIGVIQSNHPMTNWTRRVQVASVQTLQKRARPECDLVMVDEAHLVFDCIREWRSTNPSLKFIGLSATPGTRGLGKIYDHLITVSTIKDLISSGHLSPFVAYGPSSPDLSGVRSRAGDYHEGDLGRVMDTVPLVASIVDTWLEKGEWRPTLCFATNRAHARHLQKKFMSVGVSCGYIDAYTSPDDRKKIRDQFQSGELRVVVNVGCLTTGVDWDVRCIILARPTKSEMLYVQMIGRGLRTANGKTDCIILDHSNTTERLGYVTDVTFDSLCDGLRGGPQGKTKAPDREVPLPKKCPSCTRLKDPGEHVCQSCGFVPVKIADVETVEGELVLLRGGAGKNKKQMTAEQKQDFYNQLAYVAAERGYVNGWAAHKFREKTGVWPNHYENYSTPKAPSEEVLAWIKSRQIRYAKRRADNAP